MKSQPLIETNKAEVSGLYTHNKKHKKERQGTIAGAYVFIKVYRFKTLSYPIEIPQNHIRGAE